MNMIKLIPIPENIKEAEGTLTLVRNSITTSADPEISAIMTVVKDILKTDFTPAEGNAQLSFIYDGTLKEDHYSLKVTQKGISAYCSGYAGAFYALTSLRQLMMSDIASEKLVCPLVEIINDGPCYEWRGLHLDESRHFFGKETVKKYIDFMSLYKLNRFHWHLTDDHGWRIEIKKYPLLTEIGSKRRGTQLHHWQCYEMDNTPCGGYYTQEDIREIIEYARQRCVEIVPEIDFPAHSAAAIAAYNSLACREIPCEVFPSFGGLFHEKEGNRDWNRTLCLGKDEVMAFVYDVIDEVADLFPFGYFHVGGDEAPTNEWKKCSLCQQRIKDEGLKDEVALQCWFTNKVNAYLREKGKIMIGWNEVLESGLADSDIVAQYWTPAPDKNVFAHLEKGGKTILSCHKYFYFDMLHSYCYPEGTYKFTPSAIDMPQDLRKGVLGYEGEAWTEFMTDENNLFFMVFNRGLALSEASWSKSGVRDYSSFVQRLTAQKKIMDALGIYYGQDFLTMKRNRVKKLLLKRKYGIGRKHLDGEYRLSKILKK